MRWIVVLVGAGCAASGSVGGATKAERQVFVLPPPPPTSVVDRVEDGHELFVHGWATGDPQLRSEHRALGARNASSCTTCHSMGGVGGAGRQNVSATPRLGGLTMLLGRGMEHSTLDSRLAMLLGTTPTFADDDLSSLLGGSGGTLSVRGGSEPRRNTPSLFGAALIDAIPEAAITTLADTSWPDHPEVTGRLASIGEGDLGRFGWKGQSSSLADFVAAACTAELGLSVPTAEEPDADTALDGSQLASMVAYVASLPAPHRSETAGDSLGEDSFNALGCATCHVETVGQAAGVYSDFLLHDMGQRLADRDRSFGYGGAVAITDPNLASRAEWRTPPLWGVADSAPYLHDGRAQTLDDAIRQHGGEGRGIAREYAALPDATRQSVVDFLRSLRSPVSIAADEDECVAVAVAETGQG